MKKLMPGGDKFTHTHFALIDPKIFICGRANFLKICQEVLELQDPQNGISLCKHSSPLQNGVGLTVVAARSIYLAVYSCIVWNFFDIFLVLLNIIYIQGGPKK